MSINDKILVPVEAEDLDMLEWFGAWTPEVHCASWKTRRAWPPGFREVADVSTSRDEEKVRARMAYPPCRNGMRTTARLLAYRLVEGTWTCARLTPRGRAALRLAGRSCPGDFISHAPDVFDDVLLTGTGCPDHEEGWRAALVEYREDDYRGRHTLTGATASLSSCSSTGTPLNGSLRTHRRFISLRVRNAAHQDILEVSLSHEGLAELLTTSMETPVTLDHYWGPDGMRRSEPAPPPVSAKRRMLERLDAAEDRQEDVLRALITKVGAGNIPKKLQAELLHDLEVALGNGTANRAFVVTQAVEEVSVVVESAMAITAERLSLAGVTELPGTAAVLALTGMEPVARDAEVRGEQPLPEVP